MTSVVCTAPPATRTPQSKRQDVPAARLQRRAARQRRRAGSRAFLRRATFGRALLAPTPGRGVSSRAVSPGSGVLRRAARPQRSLEKGSTTCESSPSLPPPGCSRHSRCSPRCRRPRSRRPRRRNRAGLRELPRGGAHVDHAHRARRRQRRRGLVVPGCHGDASAHLKDPNKTKPRQRADQRRTPPRPRSRPCAWPATPAPGTSRCWYVEQAQEGRRDLRQLPQHPRHAVAPPTRRTSRSRVVRGRAVHDDVAQPAYKVCVECHRDTRARS